MPEVYYIRDYKVWEWQYHLGEAGGHWLGKNDTWATLFSLLLP